MSKLNYRVEVKTSNEKKAGTNENVYLKLMFTNGESSPFLLDKGDYDDFEQGDKDYYNITTENKGDLIAIEVRMLPEKASTNDVIELWNKAKSEGGLNRSPDWKLDYIVVWCDVKYNDWPNFYDPNDKRKYYDSGWDLRTAARSGKECRFTINSWIQADDPARHVLPD